MIEYLRRVHDQLLHEDYLDHISSYRHWELANIRVNSVNSDLVNLDLTKLEAYSSLDTGTVPPVVVADGVILDGYHRVTVAKAQGQIRITAWIGHS